MCSTCAESAAGMACNRGSGAGGCAAPCRREHANREIPESRTSPTLMRRNLPITGLSYLTITGASFFAAQISATNHPMMLHPRKRLSRKIARRSRLLRASAMIDGKKYNKNGKPKNGKKRSVDRIMTVLLVYSLALSGLRCSPGAPAHAPSQPQRESLFEDTQNPVPEFPGSPGIDSVSVRP